MRRPTTKAILFFIIALGAGYAVSLAVMVGLLNTELRLYGFANVSLIALLIAFILMVWFDKPFELKLFEWPADKPKEEKEDFLKPEPPRVDDSVAPRTGPPAQGGMFPHDIPTEHWDADFGNPKEVYEGTALPIWILAGWAIFIIWAVLYLVSGLPTAF